MDKPARRRVSKPEIDTRRLNEIGFGVALIVFTQKDFKFDISRSLYNNMWPFSIFTKTLSEKAVINGLSAHVAASRDKLATSFERLNGLLARLDGQYSIVRRLCDLSDPYAQFTESLKDFEDLTTLKNEEAAMHASTLRLCSINTTEVKCSIEREAELNSRQVEAIRKTGGKNECMH